ncbi:hypothetical protein SARC_08920 [Sphaeroforma arctica JP610]|uniref:Arrestin C-terminal-like domain-containing protein n=1 Tax=Sphaeroforma arctica JP610 TaxID=667725 RepID=A0A0L0FPD1_9EUKA|nr:hypothetical protein SARC_08920 [Sphaeroforma arctica JP610]KNC78662.1 hypothetical protein SARC_08920 [Sphaeroforma arctica JP610]|eukprot:XP_014152564.1 hypothetical protein SARC_08920 [Sphaeroforma arctica JP610]
MMLITSSIPAQQAQALTEPRGAQCLDQTAAAAEVLLTEREAHKPDSPSTDSPTCFSITTERDVYYGNDLVNGEVNFKSLTEVVIPRVCVAVMCRYVCKNRTSLQYKKAHTIFRSMKVIGRDYVVPVGQSSIPFSFILPTDMPASMQHVFCTVRWDLRLFRYDTNTNLALTRKAFLMSSLYYPLPGLTPTVQMERPALLRKGTAVRMEASLTKDIFTAGAPIDVHIAFHLLKRSVKVRKVVASVIQRVEHHEADQVLSWSTTVLDRSTLNSSSLNRKLNNTTEKGTALDHTFALRPYVQEDMGNAVALQNTAGDAGALVPTTHTRCHNSIVWILVTYMVDIKATLFGAPDIEMSLPLVIEGCTAIVSDNLDATALNNCKTFPTVGEDPPEYADYKMQSTRSYTSLRRNSIDTVFAKPEDVPLPTAVKETNSKIIRRATLPGMLTRPKSTTTLARPQGHSIKEHVESDVSEEAACVTNGGFEENQQEVEDNVAMVRIRNVRSLLSGKLFGGRSRSMSVDETRRSQNRERQDSLLAQGPPSFLEALQFI